MDARKAAAEPYVEEKEDLVLRRPREIPVPVDLGNEELGLLYPFDLQSPLSFAIRDDVTIPYVDPDTGEQETIDLFARNLSVLRISGPAVVVVGWLEIMLEKAKEVVEQEAAKRAAEGENGDPAEGPA